MEDQKSSSRRQLLKFLAASPLVMLSGGSKTPSAEAQSPSQTSHQQWWRPPSTESFCDSYSPDTYGSDPESPTLIRSPSEAINVFDMRDVAKRNTPPAHWGYLVTGVEGERTLIANRRAYSNLTIRPRRASYPPRFDTSVTLFGRRWYSPLALCPVASQQAWHAEGELASARASRNYLQMLSTLSSTSVDDVAAARGNPLWFQLYASDSWALTEALLDRARAAGCEAVAFTIDSISSSRRETATRCARIDTRDCSVCHSNRTWRDKPNFEGAPVGGATTLVDVYHDWAFVARLRDAVTARGMRFLVKGITTAEDAESCVDLKIDGLVVSNHGGRANESGRGTIESLPEVASVAKGIMPILFDGGVRRGTDIFKALALGADVVCIGRPYIWGLGAFGEAGVARVLSLLMAELRAVMGQVGVGSLSEINKSQITDSPCFPREYW